jgi:lysozyme
LTVKKSGLPLRVELLSGLGKGRDLFKLVDEAGDDELLFLQLAWELGGRLIQKPPEGEWLTWLLLGGRGSGKTRAGAEWVRAQALGLAPLASVAAGRIALVGETFSDVREVMIEGVSGLLSLKGGRRPDWQKSRRRLVWPNGAVAQAFSSEDPESLRGPQFAVAWADGIGHTASAGPPKPVAGMAITRPEAQAILLRDLAKFEARVAATLPDVAQHVFDGAVSFDFNTGGISRASWVRHLRAGKMREARGSLMQWTKAGGRTITGLVRRREAEARLIFDGDYGRATAAATQASADIETAQAALARLGFYKGAIDGIVGPLTMAATLAYQKTHPDLVDDGIIGPATIASLARDMAARTAAGQAAGLAVGGAAAIGVGAGGLGIADPFLWALAAGVLALLAGAGWVAIRYRDELKRLILSPKGV